MAEIWQHTNPNEESNEEDIVRLQDDYNRDIYIYIERERTVIMIVRSRGERREAESSSVLSVADDGHVHAVVAAAKI